MGAAAVGRHMPPVVTMHRLDGDSYRVYALMPLAWALGSTPGVLLTCRRW